MDPFSMDDDDAEHQPGPSTSSAAARPAPSALHTASASASASIADPFAPDEGGDDDDDGHPHQGAAAPSASPPSSSSSTPPPRAPTAAVNPTSASQLLSQSHAGPSSPRRPAAAGRDNGGSGDHVALRMDNVASSASYRDISDEEEEEDAQEEAEASGLLGKSRRRQRSSSRERTTATASTSSSASGSQRRRKRAHGSIATLKALGRRIVEAAGRAQREDQAGRGGPGGGAIHLAGGGDQANGRDAPMRRAMRTLDQREQALWMWANVDNFDEFLTEVYSYYTGKGLLSIALTRLCGLLTVAFVLGFSTFLLGCLDYSKIRHDGQLRDIISPTCSLSGGPSTLSLGTLLLLVGLAGVYGAQVVRVGLGLKRLRGMRYFYEHLLEVPERDVQTIPWHQVVERLSRLLESHPLVCLATTGQQDGRQSQVEGAGAAVRPEPQTIDVHVVANRLMRQDNYLIALLDQELLPLGLPQLLGRGEGGVKQQPLLTRSLQWNLEFCILGYLFDSHNRVRRAFLHDNGHTPIPRDDLAEGLRRRFVFMACINALFAPFIVVYVLVWSFFRYFEEYHKNPAFLGARQYTELARWKFREYNELPHHFRRRLHSSYPFADRYIAQFPRAPQAILARFVSFLAGSLAGVLLLASLFDPDLFLHFEITQGRNVLFYIGVFGAVLAVARGMVPDERLVFEPEVLLEAVVHHTHYCPKEWAERGFHSAEVNGEFAKLYDLKLAIFAREVLSVLVTPVVLAWQLPRCAGEVVDFFREHTVHVDRLGYVCSFAVFDFDDDATPQEAAAAAQPRATTTASAPAAATTRRHNGSSLLGASDLEESQDEHGADDLDAQLASPPPARARRNRNGPRHDGLTSSSSAAADKMAQSALHFAATNAWQPDHPAASLYLEKLQRHQRKQQRVLYGEHDDYYGDEEHRRRQRQMLALQQSQGGMLGEPEDLLLLSQVQERAQAQAQAQARSREGTMTRRKGKMAAAAAAAAPSERRGKNGGRGGQGATAAVLKPRAPKAAPPGQGQPQRQRRDEPLDEEEGEEPFETSSATTQVGAPRTLLEHVGRRILP